MRWRHATGNGAGAATRSIEREAPTRRARPGDVGGDPPLWMAEPQPRALRPRPAARTAVSPRERRLASWRARPEIPGCVGGSPARYHSSVLGSKPLVAPEHRA